MTYPVVTFLQLFVERAGMMVTISKKHAMFADFFVVDFILLIQRYVETDQTVKQRFNKDSSFFV